MLRVRIPPLVDSCPPDGAGTPIIRDYPDQHGRVWLCIGYRRRVACLALIVAACDAAPAFLREIDGGPHLLLRPAHWAAALGARWPGLLRELRSPGHLVARDGHQLQARVRRLVAKDRIYPIWLDTS